MAATKSVSLFPLGHVPADKTVSNADGLAEIVRTTSGNAATLQGFIYGGAILDDDTVNPAPRCPGHGLPGHDHSGGLYGRPLYRSIFSLQFSDYDLTTGAVPFSSSSVPRTRFQFTGVTASEVETEPGALVVPFFVPGCDPGPYGAYSNLGLSFVAWVHSSTSLQAGDKIKLFIANRATGADCTLEATALANGYNRGKSASDTERTPTVPGEVNALVIQTQFIASSAVATRAIDFSLQCIEGGVYTDLSS